MPPAALISEIVGQLESAVDVLRDTLCRTDLPRHRCGAASVSGAATRHPAAPRRAGPGDGLLTEGRRADTEKLLERLDDAT